jgi:hypothetical protein
MERIVFRSTYRLGPGTFLVLFLTGLVLLGASTGVLVSALPGMGIARSDEKYVVLTWVALVVVGVPVVWLLVASRRRLVIDHDGVYRGGVLGGTLWRWDQIAGVTAETSVRVRPQATLVDGSVILHLNAPVHGQQSVELGLRAGPEARVHLVRDLIAARLSPADGDAYSALLAPPDRVYRPDRLRTTLGLLLCLAVIGLGVALAWGWAWGSDYPVRWVVPLLMIAVAGGLSVLLGGVLFDRSPKLTLGPAGLVDHRYQPVPLVLPWDRIKGANLRIQKGSFTVISAVIEVAPLTDDGSPRRFEIDVQGLDASPQSIFREVARQASL